MKTSLAYHAPTEFRVPLVKRADPSESGNDQSFEASFSNLASSYIADKAPALLEYEVGFQLVDRDDAHNKAVGVFGFKAGPTWLYAPVFFVDGDLKGHELLYVKGQDVFRPLEEGWINDLLAKTPPSLGTSVNRSGRDLGVRYPDLQRSLEGPRKYARAISRTPLVSPAEKAAMAQEAARAMRRAGAAAGPLERMPDWAKIAVLSLARAAARDNPEGPPRLLDLVAEGGVKVAAALMHHLEEYPGLRPGFEAYYPADAVARAIGLAKVASAAPPPSRPRPETRTYFQALDDRVRSKLAIDRLDRIDGDHALLYSRERREAMMAAPDGIAIKDARDNSEVSTAYVVDDGSFPRSFATPDATGIYQVLAKDGGLEECLVVLDPYDAARARHMTTVVRLDRGRRAFLNAHAGSVWAGRRYDGNDGLGWFDRLAGRDLEGLDDGAYYLAVGPGGSATAPFRVVRELGKNAGGGTSYEVRFDTHVDHGRPMAHERALDAQTYDAEYSPYCDGARVHLGQETGTRIHARHGDLYVPEQYKVIRLNPDAGEDDDCGMFGYSRRAESLRLGNSLDVMTGIARRTKAMRVSVDGLTAKVDDNASSVKDALVHLVAKVGLREKEARAILEAGERSWRAHRKPAEFRVKLADAYGGDPYLTDGGPYAPGVLDPPAAPEGTFGANVPGYTDFEQEYPINDLQAGYGNRDAYRDNSEPDPRAVQVAQQASQAGQRELFDTAMIGSILKGNSDDSLVDRYLKPMLAALDANGRMLLNFFWKRERFAQRYGDTEMPELEDSLRNTFQSLGELCLYLKRKTIDASPDESGQQIDIDETADK